MDMRGGDTAQSGLRTQAGDPQIEKCCNCRDPPQGVSCQSPTAASPS